MKNKKFVGDFITSLNSINTDRVRMQEIDLQTFILREKINTIKTAHKIPQYTHVTEINLSVVTNDNKDHSVVRLKYDINSVDEELNEKSLDDLYGQFRNTLLKYALFAKRYNYKGIDGTDHPVVPITDIIQLGYYKAKINAITTT